ncbi:MAG: hypothetical protein QME60_07880, partial [Verrucomicrobiota bacterium]|nr:hypothetical protein [Verrucomicrobiota bacterium]
GDNLEINADNGVVHLRNNWLKSGWVNSFSTGAVVNLGGNISGIFPGFVDAAGQNYELADASACVNAATSLPPAALPERALTNEYVKHLGSRARHDDGALDLGAYEFNPDSDSDGMPDAREILYFASLTNMSASSDSDSDRFLDWQEYRAGTNPTNPASLLRITGLAASDSANLAVWWPSASNRPYAILRGPT